MSQVSFDRKTLFVGIVLIPFTATCAFAAFGGPSQKNQTVREIRVFQTERTRQFVVQTHHESGSDWSQEKEQRLHQSGKGLVCFQSGINFCLSRLEGRPVNNESQRQWNQSFHHVRGPPIRF